MKKQILIITIFIIVQLIPTPRDCTFIIENCICQWQQDIRLTNAPDTSRTSFCSDWCIATSGNTVHIVWIDKRDGNTEIYYKHSTNEGITWDSDVRLTNDPGNSMYPSIAVAGSLVHVAWNDRRINNQNDIYYKRSTDGGVTWGNDTRLTFDTNSSAYPSIAASGNFVCLTFSDNRNNGKMEIYYMNSSNSGDTWQPENRLTYSQMISQFSCISLSGQNIGLAWHDRRDGTGEIYFKRSTDRGVTWGADTRLSFDTAMSTWPSIVVNGTIVHVAWYDMRDGNYEIYYKRSTDLGIAWETETRLTNDPAYSTYPTLAVSGLNVHLVWYDSRDGNTEIYYKFSSNGGIGWGTDTRLTNDAGTSLYPFIAVSNSILHVIWTDNRDGNPEIYYKRNPTGNVGIRNISSEMPDKYELFQNYPNPFNSMTNVKWQMLNAGNAKIIVFDILGKEVATLVNEELNPGIYEVRFDATDLPGGIYFYRLKIENPQGRTENFIDTKKLILLK